MKSISGKLMMRMLVASLVILGIGVAVILHIRSSLFEDAASDLMAVKALEVDNNFQLKMNAGIAALYGMLSAAPQLAELIEQKDVAAVRATVGSAPAIFKAGTEFKNIRVNVFDGEGNILMRSAFASPDPMLGKSSLFRSGFKDILSGKIASFTGVDVARAGVVLSSLVGVKNAQGQVVGIAEFQSGFGSINKYFAEQGIHFVQTLNDEALKIYTKGSEQPKIGDTHLVSGEQFAGSMAWYEGLDMQQFNAAGVSIQQNKIILRSEMNAGSGMKMGYRYIGMDLDHPEVQAIIKHTDTIIINMLILIAVMLLLLFILFAVIMRRVVAKPLQLVEQGLQQVATTGRLQLSVNYQSDDEVGRMVAVLSQVFNQIAQGITQANQVVAAIGHGNFSQRLDGHFKGDFVELQQGVNAAANSVSFMMDELTKVMQGLSKGDFTIQMDAAVAPAFRQQVDAAMVDVSAVIADISRVMAQMEQGYLTSRVEVTCHGDLLKLKNSINNTLDALGGALTDIEHVMVQQTTGHIEAMPKMDQKGAVGMVQNVMTLSMTNIASTVAEVRTSLTLAVDGVSHMNASISDISGQMQQQAAALEQSAATAEEMQRQAQTMQGQASDVAQMVQAMQQQVDVTRQVMAGTIEAMQTIQQKSQQIENIVGLIDSIAFQTNLLALNAAVEAARAGEHGRGFAVVAGEVRSLAQKTAEAAKDIGQLIVSTVADVTRGNEQVNQTEQAVSQVAEGAQQVQERISMMHRSAEQTATGVSELHVAISVLDSAIQQNTAAIETISHTTEQINAQSRSVLNSLSFFQTTNLNGLLDAAVSANDFRYAQARRIIRTWALKAEVALLTGTPVELESGLSAHFAQITEAQSYYAAIADKKTTAAAVVQQLSERRQRGDALIDVDFIEFRQAVNVVVDAISAAETAILTGNSSLRLLNA